jgi:hypothetical protein
VTVNTTAPSTRFGGGDRPAERFSDDDVGTHDGRVTATAIVRF